VIPDWVQAAWGAIVDAFDSQVPNWTGWLDGTVERIFRALT